jgi:hypothetical protein
LKISFKTSNSNGKNFSLQKYQQQRQVRENLGPQNYQKHIRNIKEVGFTNTLVQGGGEGVGVGVGG